MKLIVGLGNPGPAYRKTRHNAGYMVLDELASRLGTSFSREKYRGLIAEAMANSEKLLLLKPLTFMNASGESVARAARNCVKEREDILVVYDEAELSLGTLRMRAGGSAGSHNGMKSVLERLGDTEIPRLRVGVGRDPAAEGLTEHVLGKFKPDEKAAADEIVKRACDAVMRWIDAGITEAMNEYN